MQSLTIPNPAGSDSLEAFLHPAPSGPDRPLLVVCHGFCGSAEGGSALELAAALQSRDIGLLRFRFTPFGCLSQQVAEIRAVVQYCRSRFRRDPALLGRSMGGAAALSFTAADRSIAGLCLMAAPADLVSTFRDILGDSYRQLEQGQSVTVLHEGRPVPLDPEFIRDFARHDLLAAVRSLNGIPLLIIHGRNDATVPVEHARRLYGAAGEPRRLIELPDQDHSFTGCAGRFVPAVAEWLAGTVFASRL